MSGVQMVFATYTETAEGLRAVRHLVESIRTFGGKFRDCPVWVFVPQGFAIEDTVVMSVLKSLGAEVRVSRTPESAQWFYYAGKVHAAAQAEVDAAGKALELVWMDEDTIVLQEPTECELAPGISLAYRPVMHNRSGSLSDAPPDVFWSRIYTLLSLTEEMLFPMVTPADQQKIRAYFHAGLLVVRPEKGILRRWADDFARLYNDSTLVAMCRADVNKRIFLHQTALVGGVLHQVGRAEMLELSDRYNYPIFFEKNFAAARPFNSINDVVTIRWEMAAGSVDPDWDQKLTGPTDRIAWLKKRLFKE